jgi:hypothetical protein
MLKEQKMKFIKLSLSAIIAVGALGSLANAAPLEEAIKGIEIDGFARLRYIHNTHIERPVTISNTTEAIRVSGELNIATPISDELSFGTTLNTDGYNYPNNGASAPTGDLGQGTFNFDKYYFLYTGVKGLAIIGGKYTIPTPWTESGFAGSRGNGLVALYSGISDWTFAGAAYLQTNGFNNSFIDEITGAVEDLGSKNNLYAAGIIGKIGPVGLQIWAASIEHLIDATAFAQIDFEQAGFNLRAQVNYLQLADDGHSSSGLSYTGRFDDNAGLFYGIEGGYKSDRFFITAGYTQADEDQPIYTLDDDNDGFIKFGKQLYYWTTNARNAQTYFGKGGITLGNISFEAGGGGGEVLRSRGGNGVYRFEIYGLASYQLTSKFGAELYYSYLDVENLLVNNEIQLELKYTF